jgi:hypothetical protein
MTTETDNFVLDHLRAICADSADTKRDMRYVKARLASIESLSLLCTMTKPAKANNRRPC